MRDLNGREYAKLSELEPGDEVQVDGTFMCLEEGETCEVKRDDTGDLYVDCMFGEHILENGVSSDDGDSLIGFYKVDVV